MHTQGEIYSFFINALKHMMHKTGTSQKELAMSVNISKGYMSQILNMRRNARERLQSEIAFYFGFDYKSFLSIGMSLSLGSDQAEVDVGGSKQCIDISEPKPLYSDSRLPKIIKMLEAFDADGDTKAIDAIFSVAENGHQKSVMRKKLDSFEQELRKLKKSV